MYVKWVPLSRRMTRILFEECQLWKGLRRFSECAALRRANEEDTSLMRRIPKCAEMAEGLGFEPRLTGPEPVVLPLDDPSAFCELGFYMLIRRASREIYWKEAEKLRRSENQTIKSLANQKLSANDRLKPQKIALILNNNKIFQLYFPLKTAWQ